MRIFIISFLLSIIPNFLKADVVRLTGLAPSYAGKEVVFYTYSDFLTNTTRTVVSFQVAPEGSFDTSIEISETTLIFSYLGIYWVYLYVEPGKTYELILPEYKDKTAADRLNPYFEEVRVQAGIVNAVENDLNTGLRMFDDSFNAYHEKHLMNLFTRNNFEALEADLERMEKPFKKTENRFFNEYRRYRFAMLRHLAVQQKARSISDEFFRNAPILYHNPAYMELFNQVYEKYLQYHARTDSGKKLYDDINANRSYSGVKKTLKQNTVFANDTLLELVVLKGIYDEFYSNQFSRTGLLAVLDTILSTTPIGENRIIGYNIRNKITRLMPGFPPPGFALYNADSVMVDLSDFKGKYVYLNFCSCYSYSCLNDFEMLLEIYHRHKERIEIITISTDPQPGTMTSFLKKNNYTWPFLYFGGQPQILIDYDIRAYPVYFLIDKEGNLVLSPAPSPGEGFEGKLFEVLKQRGEL